MANFRHRNPCTQHISVSDYLSMCLSSVLRVGVDCFAWFNGSTSLASLSVTHTHTHTLTQNLSFSFLRYLSLLLSLSLSLSGVIVLWVALFLDVHMGVCVPTCAKGALPHMPPGSLHLPVSKFFFGNSW